jgi:hypothetical protein
LTAARADRTSAARSAIALTLALALGMMACSDLLHILLTSTPPADSPGVPVTGLNIQCFTTFPCATWSADSKTLYIVANRMAPVGGSLQAVDPATHTFRRIASIDTLAVAPVFSPDGATMFFSVAENPARTTHDIYRMSLATGATTAVTKAASSDILISPDGTALAYHVLASSPAADTVALLDLASGARRATTVGGGVLGAFSADGTRLIMNSGLIQIWHVATGGRDTLRIAFGTAFGTRMLRGIRWSGGDFRLLFSNADYPTRVLTDTSLGGGAAITYSHASIDVQGIAWLPDRSAVILAVGSIAPCGPADCNNTLYHYDFVYATATMTTTLGTVTAATNVQPFLVFAASPDGHWLAHAEFTALYLLNQPQP